MTKQFTQEELDSLTEEERAGLMEDEGGDDDTLASDADESGDESDPASNDAEEGDNAEEDSDDLDIDQEELERLLLEEDGTADQADEEADPAAASADPADAGEQDDDSGTVAGDAMPSWVLPSDVNTNLDAIEEKLTTLAAQFDDGELTATELREQQKTLELEREKLRDQKRYADFQFRSERDRYVKETVPAFFEENPIYQKPTFQKMLDDEVKRIQASAKNPFNPKILELAHNRLMKEIKDGFGVAGEPGKQAAAKPKATKPPKRPDNTPPTLHNVPAASISTDNGRFAHLNRLAETDYLRYEAELEKLPESVRLQYLSYA